MWKGVISTFWQRFPLNLTCFRSHPLEADPFTLLTVSDLSWLECLHSQEMETWILGPVHFHEWSPHGNFSGTLRSFWWSCSCFDVCQSAWHHLLMIHGCPNPAVEAMTQPGFLSYQEGDDGIPVKASSTWKVREAGWILAIKDGPASAPKAWVNPKV